MSFFKDKNVIVGVTASIAAYKSAFLVREFVKQGANVRVIQTPESQQFITPLTLSTLSKNPVLSGLVKEDDKDVWNNHVEIGLWADLFVIAPATAKTLSKMANGECDNLLLTTYLSAQCPVFFAPAMDLDMFKHQSTQDNIDKLTSYGNIYIPTGEGELASGLSGKGRMAEPYDIVLAIEENLTKQLPLKNKNILITAGPTFEAIDPVRFIGNHSSGKMGFSIAEAAANAGANVTLVAGPTNQQLTNSSIKLVNVVNAKDMYDACFDYFKSTDIAIMSAAVSDYTPKVVSTTKMKKNTESLNIEFIKTQDILKSLGDVKSNMQVLVGFALETNDEIQNARKKISNKNLDFIVLNSMNDKGAGFKHNTNKITIIDNSNKLYKFELKSKQEVAGDIINHILEHYND
ncbi:bifunctional phosphopantothenoylcysteine decarboxylase/phosphopantothenate--cysteine ligase CoaBC [Flavobacteriales bacterium]|nr:bifunctional phosphopantothenoylcysteine decarboxylase/phosphopantothenate--cysteine ligase CoaBC [Flavobacteriales bacterium]MDC3103876.1 bifunctional phosphopantothenoylcysteine decarboxylase/phosphopantothenate--cysteine ligase CoaBC [Flavobacteriales bacterium]